eukprot:6125386-Amphidinium_carterae.3
MGFGLTRAYWLIALLATFCHCAMRLAVVSQRQKALQLVQGASNDDVESHIKAKAALESYIKAIEMRHGDSAASANASKGTSKGVQPVQAS